MPFEPAAPLPTRALSTPPVSFGSVITRTFATWWKNLLIFAAFTLVVAAPVVAVFLLLGLSSVFAFGGRPAEVPSASMLAPLLAVGLPLALLAGLVNMCGLTYGAVQHAAGKPVRLGSMISIGFRRFVPLILLVLLGTLLGLGLGLVLALVGGLLALVLGPFGGPIIAVVMIALAATLGTGLVVTIPALLVEGLGPIASLQRSWELTRGRRLAIFLGALVLVVLSLGVSAATNLFAAAGVAGIVVATLVQFLLMPLTTVIPGVVYSDLRAEKEGVATDDLAKIFE